MSPDIISTIAKEFSSCFCSACFAYSLNMFDTLVFAGSPNKDFFKHTRLWSLIKTYFSSSGISTLNLQVSASSSIDSDNRALLFVRAKGSCSTDDVDSSSSENRGSIIIHSLLFNSRWPVCNWQIFCPTHSVSGYKKRFEYSTKVWIL